MSNAVPIVFTDNAARKVHQLIMEEGDSALNLRVYISGGGCSGFQYGFTFDKNINHDDTVVKKKLYTEEQGDDGEQEDGGGGMVKLLIDPASFQYLVGAEIDYREGVSGGEFVIRNPNAKTKCGCGSSFSV